MARKKTTPGPQQVQSEDEARTTTTQSPGSAPARFLPQDVEDGRHPRRHGRGDRIARRRGGLHPQAVRPRNVEAALLRDEIEAEVGGRREEVRTKAAPKAATKPQPVEDYQTPPEQPAGRDGNLLDALEQMKPLIAQYGPDHVKRMVDLLG